MKLSKETVGLIKNFAGINSNLLLKAGNKLATVAHKKAMMDTNSFTEEITKITDSQGAVVYTIKDGFLEPAI